MPLVVRAFPALEGKSRVSPVQALTSILKNATVM